MRIHRPDRLHTTWDQSRRARRARPAVGGSSGDCRRSALRPLAAGLVRTIIWTRARSCRAMRPLVRSDGEALHTYTKGPLEPR